MDLRQALNAISDVVVNRPRPLRVFDQIYMKAGDMLVQASHVSRCVNDRDVVFIGDGDALSATLVHLHAEGHLDAGPRRVHVLDFDERMVNSIKRFSERYGYAEKLDASLYNVFDPLPQEHQGKYGAFYTNPPFGEKNGGTSVRSFLLRGIEASLPDSICCAVLGDGPSDLPWCAGVLRTAQEYLFAAGFVVAEMIPAMHTYHLDDEPGLTSCSLVARRDSRTAAAPARKPSVALPAADLVNFYGEGSDLRIKYVRDLTNGGKLSSRDHESEPFPQA